MVADVARARKRVRIFLSHIEVPQLTLGPTVRRRCEPAHIGGCKFLRSTAQIGKEACQARATKSSDNPTYLVGRERFCEGLRAGRCRRWGQSRHFDRVPVTSGLPPTADILRGRRHVSNVPRAEVARGLEECEFPTMSSSISRAR
jgi:hypothetical protein